MTINVTKSFLPPLQDYVKYLEQIWESNHLTNNGPFVQELEQKLKKISSNSPLVSFVGQIGDRKLLKYYQQCLALICPQIEDFGLTPLEAQACGKPVIAFNKGGIAETVIHRKTGILFPKQNYLSLSLAIKKFEKTHIKSSDCLNNAQKFSKQKFMIDFKNQIQHLWRLHLSQNLSQTL